MEEPVEANSLTATPPECPISAQTVFSIDDLLTKILLLLPVRSLIRFKTVSKHWLSLITDPIFCHLRNPNPNPAVGLLLPSPQNHGFYDFISFQNPTNPPFKKLEFEDTTVKILQSCNGLLLCCTALALDPRYYVYNPTTNRLLVVPTDGMSRSVAGISLAFDPAKSTHFSVVYVEKMLLDCVNALYFVVVYSSGSGNWQICSEPFSALLNFDNGVYWNGAIHWMGKGNGESLYFNVERNLLDKMPELPFRYGWNSRSNYYFGESCGHLHFIEMRCPTFQFSVYEMKMDYSEWFVKYRVDLSPIVAANPSMLVGRINPMGWYTFRFSVFSVVRGVEEEDAFLVLQTPSKALRYNLVEKTCECLREFENEAGDGSFRLRYPGASGFHYIESLCCV